MGKEVDSNSKLNHQHAAHAAKEPQKPAVIAPAYATVDPFAVVVEALYALVALSAVLGAFLHPNLQTTHGRVVSDLISGGYVLESTALHSAVAHTSQISQ
jgi:hypothetical protein